MEFKLSWREPGFKPVNSILRAPKSLDKTIQSAASFNCFCGNDDLSMPNSRLEQKRPAGTRQAKVVENEREAAKY
jgi:hypothetical protein